jgi:hypothetical protein
MLANQLTEIDERLLATVCAEHWPESQTLEFKRELPTIDARGRHEFLKDVSALANADGGDLVYGVAEHDGAADIPAPIPGLAADEVHRRLTQILDAGLEPRVNGISMRDVPFAAGGFAWIVRVPASFSAPHRYRYDHHSRFVIRNGTVTSDMSYDQVRDAFDRVGSLSERARQFRGERLIQSGATGRPMQPGPRCVVHLIPLASIAGKASADVRRLHNDYLPFIQTRWGGASSSLNLDGLVVYPTGPHEGLGYTQIFQTGVMEAVRPVAASNPHDDPDRRNVIPSLVVSSFIRDTIRTFLDATARWQVGGPAVAAAALLSVGDFGFLYQAPRGFTERTRSDRANLVLPDVWVEQLGAAVDLDTIVRPILDTLWQSFDRECCAFYDDQGRWMPQG